MQLDALINLVPVPESQVKRLIRQVTDWGETVKPLKKQSDSSAHNTALFRQVRTIIIFIHIQKSTMRPLSYLVDTVFQTKD